MSNKEELQRKIAWLESRLDQVESELSHLNHLLIHCGFPEGVKSLKITIEELLEEASNPQNLPPEDLPPRQAFDPFG